MATSFWSIDIAHANAGLNASVYNTFGQNAAPSIPQGSSPVVTTSVTNIDFNWGSGPVLGGPSEDVIVIFTGYITSDADATIQFATDADDGTRLYIDGQLIADDWVDKGGGGSVSAPVQFTANVSKPITLWFYENGGGAKVSLFWNKSGSFSVVPASAFSLSPVTPPPPPPSLNPPLSPVATVDGATVTVSWTAPESTNTAIERYAIFWSYDNFQTGWAISSTTTQAIINNVPDSSTVYIKIRSDNDSVPVYSGWSEIIQVQSGTFFADQEAARLAEEERLRQEAEAAEAERLRLEAEAERLRLEAEAAEAERLRLEEEARIAEQRRIEAEAEAARQAAIAAEAERQRIEAERRAAEEAARLKAEEEARLKAEAEEKARLEEEARLKAEEEARLKAEEEARLKAEEEARIKAEEEARIKAEEEARLKAEEEARLKAEAEARAKAEAEAKAKAEAEEQARLKAEAEAKEKFEQSKPENIIKNAASDGVLTSTEIKQISNALITQYAESIGIPASEILEAGIDYSNLPPETPIELENGVVLTAEIVDALQVFENPSEIFSDPGKALKAFANVGADMSPEVRETAEEIVVVTVIVGQMVVAAAAFRR